MITFSASMEPDMNDLAPEKLFVYHVAHLSWQSEEGGLALGRS